MVAITFAVLGLVIFSLFTAFVLFKLDRYERRLLFLKTIGRRKFLRAQQLREANLYVDDVFQALQLAHSYALLDSEAKVFFTAESIVAGLENLEHAKDIINGAVAREERFIPRMTPSEKQILKDIMEIFD